MCVKKLGETRVCLTHRMVFDRNFLRLRTLWSFAVFSNHDVWAVPMFMKEIFLTLWLSERIIRNHHWMIWTIFQCSRFLNSSSPFRDVYPSHYLNMLPNGSFCDFASSFWGFGGFNLHFWNLNSAQHWVSPQIFWIAWYSKSHVFQT